MNAYMKEMDRVLTNIEAATAKIVDAVAATTAKSKKPTSKRKEKNESETAKPEKPEKPKDAAKKEKKPAKSGGRESKRTTADATTEITSPYLKPPKPAKKEKKAGSKEETKKETQLPALPKDQLLASKDMTLWDDPEIQELVISALIGKLKIAAQLGDANMRCEDRRMGGRCPYEENAYFIGKWFYENGYKYSAATRTVKLT